MSIRRLWEVGDEGSWESGLEEYWRRIPRARRPLEERLDRLKRAEVEAFDPDEWFDFLHDEYFPWKYTAGNRLATCRGHLTRFVDKQGGSALFSLRDRLLLVDPEELARSLWIAMRIPGLGAAGASGLLSLMYPLHYGTLDQFLVRALREVDIPEAKEIGEMTPESLDGLAGVVLLRILRRKASELSERFGKQWTPRMIDMVLWGVRLDSKTAGGG